MNTNATTTDTKGNLTPPRLDRFACAADGACGMRLRFQIETDGCASADWQPSPEFCSYPDRLHGGAIATLLDSAMLHALFAKGIGGVTAEITIRYRERIDPTRVVYVNGRVDSHRRGIYQCSAELRQADISAVRATAKFMAMKPPVTGRSS